MLNSNNNTKISFCPKYPLIWFAEYDQKIKELRIPKCLSCNNLIKIKDYNNVICNYCNKQEVTWNVNEGAIIIPINNFILEFDEKGNETINYSLLPTDGLIKFGLLDPYNFMSYGIEILTGYITIGNFCSNSESFRIATGINTTSVPSNLLKISDAIINGETNIELYYAKRTIVGGNINVSLLNRELMYKFNMDESSLLIDNIAVGYFCNYGNWNFEVIIRVDCNSHIPYFTSKANIIEN